eukprot:4241529-Lingulodinium_polyedra.AAC.1
MQGPARLRPGCGSRDLFPLPLPAPAEECPKLVREAVASLNWLSGEPMGSFATTPADDMQSQVLRRVEGLCKAQEPLPGDPTPQECFRALLR